MRTVDTKYTLNKNTHKNNNYEGQTELNTN